MLEKCIELAIALTGKKPCGYRAPLYQLSETTIALLEEHGFLYGEHVCIFRPWFSSNIPIPYTIETSGKSCGSGIEDHLWDGHGSANVTLDSSLSHHDSTPYHLTFPSIKPPTFDPATSAQEWMHPLPPPTPPSSKTLVEIPCNWYMVRPFRPLPPLPSRSP